MTAPQKSFREEYGDELADRIASLAGDPEQDAKAKKAAEERASAERTARHMALADKALAALAGKFDKETKAAVERVLAGQPPRRAEVAQLVLCESIVQEYWKRRAAKRRPPGKKAP